MKSVVKSSVPGFVIAGVLLMTGCTPDNGAVPSDPGVLAVYRGGQVTASDLDEVILGLPERDRRLPEHEALERDRGLIEMIVVNRLLLEQGAAEGIRTSPDFLVVHEENRQRIVADFFIRRELAQIERVTEADARAYFEEHADELRQPAKRLTSHIFRRVTDPAELEATTREMEEIRQRVINGESFGALAREYSDSETAQLDGQLGWITEENAPPDLAAVVFAQDLAVPSEPVVTADGVHLFMVSDIMAARSYTFDEVESRIVSILVNRNRQDFVDDLVKELPKPDPYFVAGMDEMDYLLGGGDPDAEVFRIGESTLTVAQFRRRLDQAISSSGAPPAPDFPENLLTALFNRARIYEHCVSVGLLDEPELETALDRAAETDIEIYLRERSLRHEAERDAEALEAYYQANRRRFSSPLTVSADVLVVPIPEHGANALMDRLSGLDLESSTDRLATAAADLGGKVSQVENATHEQLRRWSPKVAALVSELEVGRCSQPLRVGDSIVVVEVTRRVEPEPRPFAVVKAEVVRSYLEDHRKEAYDRWSRRLLDEAGLRIFDDRLTAFWKGGGVAMGSTEPSAAPE